MPSCPGMKRSVIMRSTGDALNCWIASEASPAWTTVWLADSRARRSASLTEGSSSISRMVAIGANTDVDGSSAARKYGVKRLGGLVVELRAPDRAYRHGSAVAGREM